MQRLTIEEERAALTQLVRTPDNEQARRVWAILIADALLGARQVEAAKHFLELTFEEQEREVRRIARDLSFARLRGKTLNAVQGAFRVSKLFFRYA